LWDDQNDGTTSTCDQQGEDQCEGTTSNCVQLYEDQYEDKTSSCDQLATVRTTQAPATVPVSEADPILLHQNSNMYSSYSVQMIEADVSRKDRTASDRQSATSLQLSSSSPSQQARSLQVMRNGEEVSIKQAHRVPESETYTVQPKTEVHSVSEIDTMEQMTEFYAMSVQHTMQPMTEITTVSVRRNQKVHDIASKHHQTLLSEVEKYQDEAKEPAMHQTGDSEPGGDDQDLLHIPQHEDSVDPNDSV
jgi:hypothetical protein